ncbi:MAG: hypothetical protein K2J17_01660 [Paramuribaculum sp.]|nr:hypothetical protein [Paramuribaculum sp.]
MELITRRAIDRLEGSPDKNLNLYSISSSPQYNAMVEEIRKELDLTTLKFCTIENIVEAIGLPKDRICTHCFDGSSAHTLD